MSQTEALWTIDELGVQVALALSVDYEGAPNSRVRDVPDRRTIRYYTTLGLLDRPADMRGRTALYGRRHLLQLVAIKRLQGRGQLLATIQQQLLGLSDAALDRLARLPANLDTPAPQTTPAAPAREAFWTATPTPTSELAANGEPSGPAADTATPPGRAVWQGVPLGDDLLLLLAAARPVGDDDLQAIRVVAAPLVKLLETRRLLGPRIAKETP
jgi:DNA-binding transcriptional MerR regulator